MRRWRVWTTWLPRQRSRGLELRVGFSTDGPPPPPKRTEQEKWANAAADDADDRATHNLPVRWHRMSLSRHLYVRSSHVAARFFVPNAEPTVSGSHLSSLHYEVPPELRDPLFGMVRALAKHYLGERFAQEIRVTTSASTRLTNVSETRPLGPSALAAVHTEAHAVRPLSASQWVGQDPVGLFGSALATGDFDADGLTDIVFGAVGVGERALTPRSGASRFLRQWHDPAAALRWRRHRAVWLEPASHGF